MENLTYRDTTILFKNGRFIVPSTGFSSTDYSDVVKYIDDSFNNLVEVFHSTELDVKYLPSTQLNSLTIPITDSNRGYVYEIIKLKREIDVYLTEKFEIIFNIKRQL